MTDRFAYFREYEAKIKKLEMELKYETGRFNEELSAFLKNQVGLPESFTLIEALETVAKKTA